jgi:hypothetical protein
VVTKTQRQRAKADPRDDKSANLKRTSHGSGNNNNQKTRVVGDRSLQQRLRSALDTVIPNTGNVRVALPVVGEVKLPPPRDLAFFTAVGVLTAVGALEWPVAAIVAAGHALATSARSKTAQEAGEGMEAA